MFFEWINVTHEDDQSELLVLCLVRNALHPQTNWALLQIQEASAKADSNDLDATVMSWHGRLSKKSARARIPKNITFLEYNRV